MIIPDTINDLPVTIIFSGAFENCANLTGVTIPSSVTTIWSSAFENCTNLASATIPNSVTTLGDNATIGNGVTSIGRMAFLCFRLNAITVDGQNSAYSSANGVLFNKDQTMVIQYPMAKAGSCYTIPDNVTQIGDNAFEGCLLTNVTIPNNVTSIGDGAFCGCMLSSVTIPNNVTTIGVGTFSFCAGLTNVMIGNSVASIGYEAFAGCQNLTSVTIPNSVTNIGDIAFCNFGSLCLTEVYFEGSTPNLGGPSVFSGDYDVTIYYLPGTTGWDTFAGPTPVLWNPQAANDGNFGLSANGFGFNITATNNLTVVVASCTNLVNAVWTPVATLTLSGGSAYFGDSNWTNNPACFYRLQMP